MNYYTHIITLPTTPKQALLLPDPVHFLKNSAHANMSCLYSFNKRLSSSRGQNPDTAEAREKPFYQSWLQGAYNLVRAMLISSSSKGDKMR